MSKDVKPNEQQNRQPQAQSGAVRGGGASPSGFGLTPAEFFRMNPFSLMRRMTEEMDRVFGDFGWSRGGDSSPQVWSPAIEVTEREGKYVVRADLPGLSAGDVKLEITDDAIVLDGERKIEHDETKGGVHVSERRYGRFYRTIPLPEGAKAEEARAKFENGVLEVTVPVQEQQTRRRQIQIETTQSAPGQSAQAASTSGTNRAA